MTIRAARPEEFEAVADLLTVAYEPFLGEAPSYLRSLRDTASRARDAEVLVAVEERVLGTITFVPDGGPLAELAGEGETEFRMFGVDPATRGRGIGLALLQRVVDESRARGGRAVVCSSQPNMTTAHRIYERLGFRRDRERDWSPMPGVDLLAFTLRF